MISVFSFAVMLLAVGFCYAFSYDLHGAHNYRNPLLTCCPPAVPNDDTKSAGRKGRSCASVKRSMCASSVVSCRRAKTSRSGDKSDSDDSIL